MTREDERRADERSESANGRAAQPRDSESSEWASGDRREPRADGGDEVEIPEVEEVSGTGIPIRGNDIDTDQIIPARFMKVVTFDGLGEFSFFDLRFDEDDNEKDHPLNEERFQDANIMVVNSNFGCGSSREHAPQALMRWGIDAIIGESFAEIFAGNCLALGIPTVTADAETINALQQWVDDNPDGEISVTVNEGQRKALVDGIWDTTALMKSNANEIAKTAADLPYVEEA